MVAYSYGYIIAWLETCILLIFHTYFLAYMHKGIHKHPNICIYFYPLIHEYFHTCRVHTSVSVNLYTCTIAYTHHKYLYYCLIAYMHTFILAYLHVLIIVYSFVGMLTQLHHSIFAYQEIYIPLTLLMYLHIYLIVYL